MTTILIADATKSGLVMTSEVFKDKIAGCIVKVAASGRECLELIDSNQPDLIVVDFDLPDTDGIVLTKLLREKYEGPVFLTAYPGKIVDQAVANELFIYDDTSDWIPKPVRADVLSEKIDRFLIQGRRTNRRFDTEMETTIQGKSIGRGRKVPKASASIANLSMEGALVRIEEEDEAVFKPGDEVTIQLRLPPRTTTKVAPPATKSRGKKGATKAEPPRHRATKVKCTVVWQDSNAAEVGLTFEELSSIQRKGLESYLKAISAELIASAS